MKPSFLNNRILFGGIFISILFSSGINKSNAQGYIPFPMDSTTWTILIHDFQIALCEEKYVFNYYFTGDTIINGYNYKIIQASPTILYEHINGNPQCSYYWNWSGGNFIRQDTLNKKVYSYSFSNNSESVLYDFNLNVGDTLFNSGLIDPFACLNNPYTIVQSIDTIFIGGIYRKRWFFDCIAPIVEGFGSVDDPFSASVSNPFAVACIQYKDSIYNGFSLYAHGNSVEFNSVCSFITSSSELKLLPQFFSINYVNINNELIIHKNGYSTNNIFQFNLIDIMGRIINSNSLQIPDESSIRINLSAINNGQYIIELFNKKEIYWKSNLVFIN